MKKQGNTLRSKIFYKVRKDMHRDLLRAIDYKVK